MKCDYDTWKTTSTDLYSCDKYAENPFDVMFMYGTTDTLVPFGGYGPYPPVSYGWQYWRDLAECSQDVVEIADFEGEKCYSNGCATNITHCISNGGHFWLDWKIPYEEESLDFFCKHGGCDMVTKEDNEAELSDEFHQAIPHGYGASKEASVGAEDNEAELADEFHQSIPQ